MPLSAAKIPEVDAPIDPLHDLACIMLIHGARQWIIVIQRSEGRTVVP